MVAGFTTPGPRPARAWLWLIAGCLSLALLVGCATNKVAWNTRVGNYTYDQAVSELGPPDNSATLTDGTRVCDWITNRSSRSGVITAWQRDGFATYYDVSPEWVLRLTFDPDGKLKSWKKVAK